ncbi:hypothetical protein [Bradyrhizobium genosp. P]|uniref:hypothetical protein n=1 Tax=Bradyrhizobium genosp. P TaxID=83641 RepID=UPI003CF4A82D
MRLDTRIILIALVILNAVAIGMSEIQRRALIERSQASQIDFRTEAGQWSEQQEDLLKRTSAQLAEITARLNRVEIQTLSSADANKRIREIYDGVQDMQTTLQALKQPQPAR